MKSMWLTAFALTVSVSGCALLGVGTGDSTSGAGTTTGGTSAIATGTSCGVDPNTGVTLCLGISTCPNLALDTEVFPACGFRISGNILDVECVCGGQLCPVGAAATCDALTTVLSQQTEGTVCAQTSGGTCTEIAATTTTSSAASSGGSGTCDTACRDECTGDPTCIQNCGC